MNYSKLCTRSQFTDFKCWKFTNIIYCRTTARGIRPLYATKVLAALDGPALQDAVAAATEAVEAKLVAAIAETMETKQALVQANICTELQHDVTQSWIKQYKRMEYTARVLSLLAASFDYF